MTRRRRLLLSAAVFAACVCLSFGVLAMLPPRPGVTKANFDRIEMGMTLAEVKKLFGEGGVLFGDTMTWGDEGDRNVAFINFANDRVERKHWHSDGETTLDKIRRWLGMGKQGPHPVVEDIQ